MRVFLDNNVLASALASRGLCAELFESVPGHELLTSEQLLVELRRILTTKPKIPAKVADGFAGLIASSAEIFPTPTELPEGIPDPDDAPMLAAALTGRAECFVTGDKALLELGEVAGMPVISPRRFWELTRLGK